MGVPISVCLSPTVTLSDKRASYGEVPAYVPLNGFYTRSALSGPCTQLLVCLPALSVVPASSP